MRGPGRGLPADCVADDVAEALGDEFPSHPPRDVTTMSRNKPAADTGIFDDGKKFNDAAMQRAAARAQRVIASPCRAGLVLPSVELENPLFMPEWYDPPHHVAMIAIPAARCRPGRSSLAQSHLPALA